MSTRSVIALLIDNQHYKSIYCHHDGYEEKPGVGYKLRHYYNSEQQVKELIELGDLSSISQDNVDAYHRDWGRPRHQNQSQITRSYEALRCLAIGKDADYLYRFENGEWLSEKLR